MDPRFPIIEKVLASGIIMHTYAIRLQTVIAQSKRKNRGHTELH
jgi:hypothetical protein